MSTPLSIRVGEAGDIPYVLDSFVDTYSRAPHAHGASRELLASLMEPLLSSPDWRIAVATPYWDPTVIVGYIVYRPAPDLSIAWVHTRGPWRRRGVARLLLAHAGLGLEKARGVELEVPFMVQRVSAKQPALVDIARKHHVTVRFRPYLPLEVQRRALLDEVARDAEAPQ